MNTGPSLQTIMNNMVNRLEDIMPEGVYADMAAGAEWPMIEVYIRLDPLLADLFKQYQDARNQYKTIEKERGAHDPLVDVTRDMADSAHAAVTTRYIELQDDEEFQGTATGEVQRIQILDSYSMENDAIKRAQKDDDIYTGIAFMLWAATIMEQKKQMETLRQSFARAFKPEIEAA
jgi:hypothetical protein